MSTLPIPLGTPSHLGELFNRMYGSYSRDPLPVNTLIWSLGTATSAYLQISGGTATLYITTNSGHIETQFNLAWKTSGNDIIPPTLDDLRTFITAGGYISVSSLSAPIGSLSALVIPEGHYILSTSSAYPISRTTSLNY